MNLVSLTEIIVKRVVKNVEVVSVKEYETTEENSINIEIMVDDSDKELFLQNNSRLLNALKIIVIASSYINNQQRVNINIDSF